MKSVGTTTIDRESALPALILGGGVDERLIGSESSSFGGGKTAGEISLYHKILMIASTKLFVGVPTTKQVFETILLTTLSSVSAKWEELHGRFDSLEKNFRVPQIFSQERTQEAHSSK
ncbi:hypothetical protein [Leptospira stimsonii]|uniref:Uncharacterized protein n=1 Tax=Leptospira stimsonii TaxID=2202203 RepID=A0ABY2N3Z6_9LEPT|nr:hypothetical protein [Leptospira stimsonii]TGK22981.1 hypothetical protein EHO98_06840 [Leptospira stimsonii]TGM16586.1 hypothetical protein EHQ90_09425 [Leptospira stimsonii]